MTPDADLVPLLWAVVRHLERYRQLSVTNWKQAEWEGRAEDATQWEQTSRELARVLERVATAVEKLEGSSA
jgi:hypothetical protein